MGPRDPTMHRDSTIAFIPNEELSHPNNPWHHDGEAFLWTGLIMFVVKNKGPHLRFSNIYKAISCQFIYCNDSVSSSIKLVYLFECFDVADPIQGLVYPS